MIMPMPLPSRLTARLWQQGLQAHYPIMAALPINLPLSVTIKTEPLTRPLEQAARLPQPSERIVMLMPLPSRLTAKLWQQGIHIKVTTPILPLRVTIQTEPLTRPLDQAAR